MRFYFQKKYFYAVTSIPVIDVLVLSSNDDIFTMSSDARRALAEGHIANSIRATEIIQFFVIFHKIC